MPDRGGRHRVRLDGGGDSKRGWLLGTDVLPTPEFWAETLSQEARRPETGPGVARGHCHQSGGQEV